MTRSRGKANNRYRELLSTNYSPLPEALWIWGVPIDARGEFAGTFLGLLGPYPLLVGVSAGRFTR